MRIDSHQHFWRYNPVRDGWITADMLVLRRDYLPPDLLPELNAAGIDACVAVQADQSEDETHFLLDLAGRRTFICGVVGWVDLASRDLPARLEYFSRFPKLRGFRHIAQSEPDDDFLVRDDIVKGIAALARFDFTYDILIYPQQFPAALKLVERLPDQRFVIDHIAKPAVKTKQMGRWADHIRAAAANHNVFCKVSGLITEADWLQWRAADFRPYLDVVFEAFGADRLMFGSDWPVCLLAGTYGQTVDLIADYIRDRPALEQQQIFGANAARFYRVTAPPHGSTN